MRMILCDPAAARTVLEILPGAHLYSGNPGSYELWRIRFMDAVAIAYPRGVLPQGKRPERIAEALKDIGSAQMALDTI